MWKLYLDDVRKPPDDSWTVARSMAEAVAACTLKGKPVAMSLDHDLGLIEKEPGIFETDERLPTGYDFVVWLCEGEGKEYFPNLISVHSMNPAGKERMLSVIKNYNETRGNDQT